MLFLPDGESIVRRLCFQALMSLCVGRSSVRAGGVCRCCVVVAEHIQNESIENIKSLSLLPKVDS
jgi:hypothetical protein